MDLQGADSRQQIEAILAGDTKSFARIVDDHQKLVNHIVFRFAPCEADREDLCQEIFLKVYQNLSRFRYQSKLSTWIARIAYNACLTFVEKKRLPLGEVTSPEGETIDDYPAVMVGPDRWAETRQVAVRLCEEIDKLPVRYGIILSLYHLQEMNYSEIGEILSMPDGTVKSYLFRARQLLRQRVENSYAREGLCA